MNSSKSSVTELTIPFTVSNARAHVVRQTIISLFNRTKVLQLVKVPVLMKLFTYSFPLFSVEAEERPTAKWHVEQFIGSYVCNPVQGTPMTQG